MHVLLISDNILIYNHFTKLIKLNKFPGITFDFRYSYDNDFFARKVKHVKSVKPLNLLKEVKEIIKKYDLVISLHSKQVFPPILVKNVRCINFHPGLNPYNRGWFPHMFSIVNGLPSGTTIHEVDVHLDHGPIIAQKEVKLRFYDTSSTAYRRIIKTELKLMEKYFEKIIKNTYKTVPLPHEGNINYKKTFQELREIDLKQKGTFQEFFDRLRALSHVGYNNAFIIDPKTKQKFYLELKIKPEKKK
jgi:dTDP-4-amino-4,6-dideoxyglucose formyltransferase